jgi:hypothetical protein
VAKPIYQIRIIANACLTRYDQGERSVEDIVDSYQLAEVDRTGVLAQVYAKRPELEVQPPAQ